MAFDLAWNFRNTLGFRTDAATDVFANSAQGYPTTYTNGNGYSLNAGWTPGGSSSYNDSATNDVRIAGQVYRNNTGVSSTWQVDLASGSAPGAGTYAVDLAFGATYAGPVNDFKLFDSTTLLIDGTNGGAGYATAGGHYRDATLTDIAATTTWTGTTVNKTFATTTAKLTISIDTLSSYTAIDHFRLTLQASGTNTDITPPSAVRLV
jgi:hypothetical protein